MATTQVRPVRIHLAMKDGPLPKSIRQVLSVVGNEERFTYVDRTEDADLVLFTEARDIEGSFSQERAYGLVGMSTGKQTFPENVTILGVASLLVEIINLVVEVGQSLRPLAGAEAEVEKSTVALLPDAKRILVIDDTPQHIASAKKCLAGHRLTTATGYEEAMKTLASEQFDIVLTDLNLPMSSKTLGEHAFKLGELVPYGLLLMIEAARQGARHVAVVTDLGHHNDPFSAAFDHYSRFPVTIEGARVMMLHARVTEEGKDWSEAMTRLLG